MTGCGLSIRWGSGAICCELLADVRHVESRNRAPGVRDRPAEPLRFGPTKIVPRDSKARSSPGTLVVAFRDV